MTKNYNEVEWYSASEIENVDTLRNDVVWNNDLSMFRLVPLLWWDDASYIRYQSEDLVEDFEF